jgi:hypothetical protein
MVGTIGLDNMLNGRYAGFSSESLSGPSKMRVGDIVRWASGMNSTHFANFIFRDDNKEEVVFSKTGITGPYEIRTTNQISAEHPDYGSIKGYYRPITTSP